jgi:hypothetical protein
MSASSAMAAPHSAKKATKAASVANGRKNWVRIVDIELPPDCPWFD